MQHAVVIFPQIPTSDIDAIRKRFDPQYGRIAPHITLVFPTSASLPSEQLSEHLRQVASTWVPFPIRLHGIRRESVHWLVLDVPEGADQIRALHDELYTGPLAGSMRRDIPYTPHLTLGVFSPVANQVEVASAELRWNEAWTAAVALRVDFVTTVGRVSLLTIAETQEITTACEFAFGGERIGPGA
jgi:2'-5' RNA ligase